MGVSEGIFALFFGLQSHCGLQLDNLFFTSRDESKGSSGPNNDTVTRMCETSSHTSHGVKIPIQIVHLNEVQNIDFAEYVSWH